MSNAKRCQRCKEFYDPFDLTIAGECLTFSNPEFQTPTDANNGKITRYLLGDSSDALRFNRKVDLCVNCTKDFISFMEGRKVEELEYGYWRQLSFYGGEKDGNKA